jgi:hypothetical protein
MARSETRATLASGSFMGVISVLMQLRKVRGPGRGRKGRGPGSGPPRPASLAAPRCAAALKNEFPPLTPPPPSCRPPPPHPPGVQPPRPV